MLCYCNLGLSASLPLSVVGRRIGSYFSIQVAICISQSVEVSGCEDFSFTSFLMLNAQQKSCEKPFLYFLVSATENQKSNPSIPSQQEKLFYRL